MASVNRKFEFLCNDILRFIIKKENDEKEIINRSLMVKNKKYKLTYTFSYNLLDRSGNYEKNYELTMTFSLFIKYGKNPGNNMYVVPENLKLTYNPFHSPTTTRNEKEFNNDYQFSDEEYRNETDFFKKIISNGAVGTANIEKLTTGGSRKKRKSSRRKTKKRPKKTNSKKGNKIGSKKLQGKKKKSKVKRRSRNNNNSNH